MSSSQEPRSIHSELASTLTAYHDLMQKILDTLASFAWTKEHLFGVQMALEEALSNAVRHGNKHDPNKLVHVDCELAPNRFYVKVCDEGQGYDPCKVPDCCADENLEVPGGRGLALMRAYMTRVELSDCGRCVTMEKVIE
jgi:serine/threonine-protein kinase RsbW